MKKRSLVPHSFTLVLGLLLLPLTFADAQVFTCDYARQGFGMRLAISNRGDFGRVAYKPCELSNPTSGLPNDSIGLEYPIGARVEHVYGGGLWIGGLLDTARVGTSPPLRLVSVTYEGWTGPLYEFLPGSGPNDRIWKANRRDTIPPAGWNDYWGNSLRFNPISDQDMYCTYTDTVFRPSGTAGTHIPLNLKVIQSSYAWNDPYAEAIIIFEYKIINVGRKQIDSAFVGYFFEADVGPYDVPNFWQRNFTEYLSASRTAYVHNPVDRGSTPAGATLLATSRPLQDLTYTFRYFPGPSTPQLDQAKYAMLSSGRVDSSEFPSLSDSRFVFAFGPFTVKPRTDDHPADTINIAVAIVSGYSARLDHRIVLATNGRRATDIYINQGIALPSTPPSPPLRVNVGFRRVELDWKWRQGDDVLYGYPDPERNWDTTNVVAPRDSARISPPYPPWLNLDSLKGGRNFEAYRLWRSETPSLSEQSWTLLQQYDTWVDTSRADFDSVSFEFNTGLKYEYVDSNLFRGKFYAYSVTSKSIPNLVPITIIVNGEPIEVEVPIDPLESSKRVFSVADPNKPLNWWQTNDISTGDITEGFPFDKSNDLGKVLVVPNPYRTDMVYRREAGGYEPGIAEGWDENKRQIKFINLPEVCTIRVFSLSGDLIRTLYHDGRNPAAGYSRGDHDMILLSDSNRALASGIYIFTVESDFGVQTGKFVLIR